MVSSSPFVASRPAPTASPTRLQPCLLAQQPCLPVVVCLQTYADYNAVVAKDPQYIESGKNVDTVVRAVNLQM
jgi:hypothetical protein